MRYSWLASLTVGSLLGPLGCPADDEPQGAASTGTTGGQTSTDTATESATAQQGGTTGTSGPSGTASTSDGSATDATTTGGEGSTTTSGSSTTGSTTAAGFCRDVPITDLDSAVALLYADVPPLGGGSGTATTTAGGPEDDDLWVRLGNTPVSCADPWGEIECEQGVTKWWITMRIPLELQMPGEYSFDDVNLYVSSRDGECNGGTTTGGRPSPTGTVYIDELTDTTIVGCIVSDEITELDPNGTFTAERCAG